MRHTVCSARAIQRLIFILAITLLAVLIPACNPAPTPTVVQATRWAPSVTPVDTLAPSLPPTEVSPSSTPTRTPTLTLTSTVTMTPTMTFTPAPSFTLTETPTITPTFTRTETPTKTLAPTATRPPMQVGFSNCESSTIPYGQRVYATGYLSVPVGQYSLGGGWYVIELRQTYQWQSNGLHIRIGLRGGRGPNSMYFDDRKIARINDDAGNLVEWQMRNGTTIYVSQRAVTVEGEWQESCTISVDYIGYRRKPAATAEPVLSTVTPDLATATPRRKAATPTAAPTYAVKPLYLGEIEPSEVKLGYGKYSVGVFTFSSEDFTDNIHQGDPIVLHGVEYPHGIFAHAPSRLVYRLPERYKTLSVTLGMVDWINCGNGVFFSVLVDDIEAYASYAVYPDSAPTRVDIPIKMGTLLTLLVADRGDYACDWAIWGDPLLH